MTNLSTLLHDTRTRQIALQALLLALVAGGVGWLILNTVSNLDERGITGGFSFLDRAARFPIAESIIAYRPTDSFGWAFLVGLGNTLFLAVTVALAATLLGLGVALARRSAHPLTSGAATVYVEAMRNTPLVVQLLFWYALVTLGLPNIHAAFTPIDGVILADRGLYLPRPVMVGDKGPFLAALVLGLVAVGAAWRYGRVQRLRTGIPNRYGRIAILSTLLLLGLVWVTTGLTLSLDRPVIGRFNATGGMGLSPEFTAVFAGLLLYSAAFIGEIIRGGIDAVDRGQWEAGRALGLEEGNILRLIVIPQALRVIIPPMTSQYINITKNTTLALAVGYPDIALVAATTINQTGQAVEGILILMLVFLTLSITASLFMNWYNRRIALVTR
ncbi:amino acid ABC transporter permease [Niveispirillum cyanobacteriorum]|uniref:Amino acid ABC transporter permease n=1 Tax=Niveispirillum cyanobacteriorum TaxID=1612173 RepID=A0A2K9NDQ9_9PROT|nr:ABC transporter permease subunit [Niveispirillum cyanobacteriorum]AUN31227.1 amino acid ABC transporter permease [Niveispirillum cyanobacteriorum]GGE73123.1 ABC transporter permease [Niveispirillum cyanobacteriorum]